MHTTVTLLANHGPVTPLKFAGLVLMRPELLNGCSSAVIRAAPTHVDEMGCLRKVDVYATLIVELASCGAFQLKGLWREAADFGTSGNPNGIPLFSPRLRGTSYPGSPSPSVANPCGVAPHPSPHIACAVGHSPVGVYVFSAKRRSAGFQPAVYADMEIMRTW